MANENVWKKLDEAKADLVKRANSIKRAFMEMPGGMPADPAAGGMPPEAAGAPGGMPADPAAGGMPPEAAGADPAMMAAMAGGMPPMGVDPATAGMLGGMPVDPAAAGAAGAMAGGAGAGTPEPTLTLTLSQLWDVVTKVLGLAKKIGANGQGVAEVPAQAQPAGQDAIKAAVIEALGDMGLNQMKMASDNAKALADEAAIKQEVRKSIGGQLNNAKKGTTIKFPPKLVQMMTQYRNKFGERSTNEMAQRVPGSPR